MQTNRLLAKALCFGVLPAAVVLAGFGLSGCRDDEAGPDPCQDVKANPLTFRFVEAFGTPTPDTAYNSQTVSLQGPGAPYTSYKWLIGQIDERTDRNTAVRFDRNTLGSIPVRLIAKRPPNTACFKNDDGVDTLTKVLTLMPFRDQRAPVYGKFQGANLDALRDTFTVRIYSGPNFRYPNNPAAEFSNYVVGIPRGCRTPYHEVGITWRGVSAGGGNGCAQFNIKGYLTTRDSIRIEYRTQVTPTIVDKVFVGKRIR